MSKRTKAGLVSLGIVLASAVLGWLQTTYGVDIGLCPPATLQAPAADAGAR